MKASRLCGLNAQRNNDRSGQPEDRPARKRGPFPNSKPGGMRPEAGRGQGRPQHGYRPPRVRAEADLRGRRYGRGASRRYRAERVRLFTMNPLCRFMGRTRRTQTVLSLSHTGKGLRLSVSDRLARRLRRSLTQRGLLTATACGGLSWKYRLKSPI